MTEYDKGLIEGYENVAVVASIWKGTVQELAVFLRDYAAEQRRKRGG